MRTTDELISVIVPVYNCEKYVEECISSIQEQTYENIEIIVVDDGSTDRSVDICNRISGDDARVRVLKQENRGVVLARQKGVEHAGGKYIAFVDADDRIENDMLDAMIANIDGSELVSVGMIWEEKQNRHVKRRDLFPAGSYTGDDLKKIFVKMIYDVEAGMSQPLSAWLCNKLFVTERVKRLYSRLDTSLKVYEDAAFVYMYALGCSGITFLDIYPYHYRYDSDSASHKKSDTAIEETGRAYSCMCKYLADAPAEYNLGTQLQHWIMEKCYFVINERMTIPPDSRVIRYYINAGELSGKRIVIYGAGRVGRDVVFQLEKAGITPLLWVDKRYEDCRREGLKVDPPDSLADADYDLVVVAVEDKDTVQDIAGDLLRMGLDAGRIATGNVRRLF